MMSDKNKKEELPKVIIENEDEIRQRIRRRLRENMQRSGTIEFNDKLKKQLKEEIKRDMLTGTKMSFFEALNSSNDNERQTQGNSAEAGPSQINQSDEELFQEQLMLAIEISKMDLDSKIETSSQPSNSSEDHTPFECGICLEMKHTPAGFGCEHKYCTECVTSLLSTAINEGLLDTMKCADPECDQVAPLELTKKMVTEELFGRYENLMLKAAVADMDDIVYCTNAQCGTIIQAETDIGYATCPKCGNTFCTNCSKPFHGTSDCELNDHERKEMLRMFQDELIAEKILQEESLNQFAIEALEREDEELQNQIREEQNLIRLQEQLENEEIERQQEENRRLEAERVRRENELRERERIEYENSVRQNHERERQERVRRESRRKEDLESENTVKQTSKSCPNCKSPIEKNGGCVHMTCTKCSHEFCWECLGRWSHDHTCRTLFNIFRR